MAFWELKNKGTQNFVFGENREIKRSDLFKANTENRYPMG